jgi:hypothetical protein
VDVRCEPQVGLQALATQVEGSGFLEDGGVAVGRREQEEQDRPGGGRRPGHLGVAQREPASPLQRRLQAQRLLQRAQQHGGSASAGAHWSGCPSSRRTVLPKHVAGGVHPAVDQVDGLRDDVGQVELPAVGLDARGDEAAEHEVARTLVAFEYGPAHVGDHLADAVLHRPAALGRQVAVAVTVVGAPAQREVGVAGREARASA